MTNRYHSCEWGKYFVYSHDSNNKSSSSLLIFIKFTAAFGGTIQFGTTASKYKF
jgi:hypothetical protein